MKYFRVTIYHGKDSAEVKYWSFNGHEQCRLISGFPTARLKIGESIGTLEKLHA